MIRKVYEDNWRDELACRFWYWLSRVCERLGGHYWGRWKGAGHLYAPANYLSRKRVCRLCRCMEVQSNTGFHTTTAATNATSITLSWVPPR